MATALPLSIIVPVYKVEHYLPTMLDSILAQTFRDYELLLIDDGSPDDSGKICDDYAVRDERIRVIHKENGGVSSARNSAIEEARGEYIFFADADDYLYAECLATMMGEVGGRDFLRMGLSIKAKRNENAEQLDRQKVVAHRLVADDEAALKANFVEVFTGLGNLWRCLFKRSIIMEAGLRMDTRFRYCEDQVFIYQYFQHIHSAVCIDYQGYVYFMTPDSATHDYRRIPEYDLVSTLESEWANVESRYVEPAQREAERKEWIYYELYLKMLMYALKGYLPGAAVERKERLRRWKLIRHDAWFQSLYSAKFWKPRPVRMAGFVCKYGLYPLADPVLWYLGKKNKLKLNFMQA